MKKRNIKTILTRFDVASTTLATKTDKRRIIDYFIVGRSNNEKSFIIYSEAHFNWEYKFTGVDLGDGFKEVVYK